MIAARVTVVAAALAASNCLGAPPPTHHEVATYPTAGGPPGGYAGATRTQAATVRVIEQQHTYPVDGRTPNELRRSLYFFSPRPGRHARTEWFIRWRYPFSKSANGCATGVVTVTVNVLYTLPQFRPSQQVHSSLQRRWQRYMHNLTVHERGHRDIGVRAGEEIKYRLQNMAARASCDDMRTAADTLAHQIVGQFRAVERQYDAQTNHGQTQGARF